MLIEQRSRGAHTSPQPPQLVELEVVSTHVPPQRIWPAGQGALHVPALQVSPAAHARPHMPQLARSVCVSTHVPPQLSKPRGHIGPESVGPASVGPASMGGIEHDATPKLQPAPLQVPSVEPAAVPERQRPVTVQKPQPAIAVHAPQVVKAAQGSALPSIPASIGGGATSGLVASIGASVRDASPASRTGVDASPQAASAATVQQTVSHFAFIRSSISVCMRSRFDRSLCHMDCEGTKRTGSLIICEEAIEHDGLVCVPLVTVDRVKLVCRVFTEVTTRAVGPSTGVRLRAARRGERASLRHRSGRRTVFRSGGSLR